MIVQEKVREKIRLDLAHYIQFEAARVEVHQWYMGIEKQGEVSRREATEDFMREEKVLRRETHLVYVAEFIEPALGNQGNFEIDYRFVRGKLKQYLQEGVLSQERFEDLIDRLESLATLVPESH